MKRFLSVSLVVLGLAQAAFAHAHLKSSVPAEGATVKVAPNSIHLVFTEAVNVQLSTFKIYAGTTPAKASLDTWLADKSDAARRLDNGLTPAKGDSADVSIALKSTLVPGSYVAFWKVMAADDGHITEDSISFTVAK